MVNIKKTFLQRYFFGKIKQKVLHKHMKEGYKEEWQKYYGESPYTETDEQHDLSPDKFAEEMLGVFESAGILDNIGEEKIAILASSVSTGKKDWAFLEKLDIAIGALTNHHEPEVFLTDFAITPEGKSVIQKPQETDYRNLNFHIVASDAYHLPFRDSFFRVLYERLGALYHAADEDIERKTGGTLTQKMLEEYKRVLDSKGRIIIDWINSKLPVSTAQEISRAAKEDIEKFFEEAGFKVEFAGENEGFIILTKKETDQSSV